MEQNIFSDFNLSDFWEDSDYARQAYIEEIPTNEFIQSIEKEIGYKLPASYIELMKSQNGGLPKNTCYPTSKATSWAENHVAITGIMGIGRTKMYSLCGELGSQFMIKEWGYPKIGVCICDCPSAGHDMIMLDYSKCGKEGEPKVVHIDQEVGYKKTVLAKDFETFIRGLVNDEVYDTSEQDLKDTLETFKTGRFSDTLQQYFNAEKNINFDKILRNLFTELSNEKGYFALHGDILSYLAYDIQFYLLTLNKKVETKEEFVKLYPEMVALGNNEISTGGYASFFEDWFDEKIKNNEITKSHSNALQFTEQYKQQLFLEIKRYE
jgi:SMI1-KNR4 cell-wall